MTRSLAPLLAILLAAAPLAAQEAQPQESQTLVEKFSRARSTFEYGEYSEASKMLQDLLQHERFESAQLRGEAYRLLGLALFNQGRKDEAYSAFLEYLYLDPDAELDPFYVAPAAVALFEKVKKEAEPQLAPLRAQRHAELETRRKAAEEEAARRRQRALEEDQRRMQPSVERRVVQREFWVSAMPFGLGQLQNGDRSLGYALATSEVIAGATSAGSALLIESLRDGATGKFDPGVYPLATRLSVAKWIGAGVFYALWIGGAVHAALHFKPESPGQDRIITPPAAPASPQPPPPSPSP